CESEQDQQKDCASEDPRYALAAPFTPEAEGALPEAPKQQPPLDLIRALVLRVEVDDHLIEVPTLGNLLIHPNLESSLTLRAESGASTQMPLDWPSVPRDRQTRNAMGTTKFHSAERRSDDMQSITRDPFAVLQARIPSDLGQPPIPKKSLACLNPSVTSRG